MADQDENETGRPPAVPGMLRDDASEISGDTPDEPATEEDEDDPMAHFDEEDAPLAVVDDDTLGVDEQDGDERGQGATEA